MRRSILDGLPLCILEKRLETLQLAYLDVSGGGKVEVAAYNQGTGAKSVTYTRANIADLTQAILTVQNQIDRLNGNERATRRRAVRPLFR